MISISPSYFVTLSFVLFVFIQGIGGNENGTHKTDSSPFASRCELVTQWRTTLLKLMNTNYPEYEANCDVPEDCNGVNCTAATFTGPPYLGSIRLSLCGERPEVEFSLNLPRIWNRKWTRSFGVDEKSVQVAEIKQNTEDKSLKKTTWNLNVLFNKTQSLSEAGTKDLISLETRVKICEINSTAIPCPTDESIVTIPTMPLSRLCDEENSYYGHNNFATLLSSSQIEVPANIDSSTVSRSSRSSPDLWSADKLHHPPGTSRKLKSSIGQNCSNTDIFACGSGAACFIDNLAQGVCKCLTNFTQESPDGPCVEITTPTVEPIPKPIATNSSYSAALGAIFSILILLVVAAAVFFGTKYHVFARVRNRIPIYYRNCWLFPRSRRSYDDNVTMVNPLAPDDDDPPLL